MILLIDNYDSFTYNLYQYMTEHRGAGAVEVVRNDALALDEPWLGEVESLVISPGPGRPAAAGRTLDAIRKFAGRIPVLGICLGHQAIGEAFGASVVHASRLMHGKTSQISHDGKGLFRGLPERFTVMRYHSLCLDEASIPDCFEVSARADDGEIMAMRHKEYPMEGIQFHPESFATEHGREIVRAFLDTGGRSDV